MNVMETYNYERFELHEGNRDIHQNVSKKGVERLIKSMEQYGWIDAYPLHVIKNGGSKLKIKGGHHRFHAARKLGIPVKYVICSDGGVTINELEESTTNWTVADYMSSYVRQGLPDYLLVKKYVEVTGVPLTVAISLIGGESAGSSNKTGQFKKGKFKAGDQTHANNMKYIILKMKALGLENMIQMPFLMALSKCLRVPNFKKDVWVRKCNLYPHMVKKQALLRDYIDMIEKVYNWKSQQKIPLAFLAEETAKKRAKSFGKEG